MQELILIISEEIYRDSSLEKLNNHELYNRLKSKISVSYGEFEEAMECIYLGTSVSEIKEDYEITKINENKNS